MMPMPHNQTTQNRWCGCGRWREHRRWWGRWRRQRSRRWRGGGAGADAGGGAAGRASTGAELVARAWGWEELVQVGSQAL